MMEQGLLIVLSGPSGTGKGAVCRELLSSFPECQYSVSVTTRAPRENENKHLNYHFVSDDNFKKLVDNGELLEWAKVYDNYYGTPKNYVINALKNGKNIILEIDIQGALQIKKQISDGIYIYIVPPSFEELVRRIYSRGTDHEDIIKMRLNSVNLELGYINKYDYVVINDKIEIAAQRIKAIIIAEKCRLERNKNLLKFLYKDKKKNNGGNK